MSFVIRQGLFLLDIADHYAVLGLPVDAGSKTVRKAYLKIAQRLHPDTCKAKDDAEKQLASELLSKLVNPAYEQLSKQASWSEFQVILKQLSKQLANNSNELKLKSAIAQDLLKNINNLEVEYHNKVTELAKSNYQDVAAAIENIGALSELNLVFLKNTVQESTGLLTNSASPGRATQTSARNTRFPSGTATGAKTTASSPRQAPEKSTTSSSLEAAIWRGEQHLKKKNYAKATLEFRDAIKLDPNSVKAHALMGISYLQQNQLAMAKVHIKKAYMAKPSDPFARKAKQLLEKAMGSALETQTSSKKSQKPSNDKKGGLFGGLFGGKKK